MKHRTVIRAIRANCIDCSGGQLKEVRECYITWCALWPYRMGKRPVKFIEKAATVNE
jgi:hypothetical protein